MQLYDILGRNYVELSGIRPFDTIGVPERERIEDQSYIGAPDYGISVVLPDHETVAAVHLFAGTTSEMSRYPYELPEGLTFDMSRKEIRGLLGEPEQQGEESTVPVLGRMPPWDIFARGGHRIHVEYDWGENRLRLVTLMPR